MTTDEINAAISELGITGREAADLRKAMSAPTGKSFRATLRRDDPKVTDECKGVELLYPATEDTITAAWDILANACHHQDFQAISYSERTYLGPDSAERYVIEVYA